MEFVSILAEFDDSRPETALPNAPSHGPAPAIDGTVEVQALGGSVPSPVTVEANTSGGTPAALLAIGSRAALARIEADQRMTMPAPHSRMDQRADVQAPGPGSDARPAALSLGITAEVPPQTKQTPWPGRDVPAQEAGPPRAPTSPSGTPTDLPIGPALISNGPARSVIEEGASTAGRPILTPATASSHEPTPKGSLEPQNVTNWAENASDPSQDQTTGDQNRGGFAKVSASFATSATVIQSEPASDTKADAERPSLSRPPLQEGVLSAPDSPQFRSATVDPPMKGKTLQRTEIVTNIAEFVESASTTARVTAQLSDMAPTPEDPAMPPCETATRRPEAIPGTPLVPVNAAHADGRPALETLVPTIPNALTAIPSMTSATLPAAPSPQGPSQVVSLPSSVGLDIVALVASGVDGPVTLQMRPEDLGLLQFHMTRTSEGLHIHLTVDQPATLDLLRRHSDDLLADLQRAGFAGTSLSYAESGGHEAHDGRTPDPRPEERLDHPAPTAFQRMPMQPAAGESLCLRL